VLLLLLSDVRPIKHLASTLTNFDPNSQREQYDKKRGGGHVQNICLCIKNPLPDDGIKSQFPKRGVYQINTRQWTILNSNLNSLHLPFILLLLLSSK